MSLSARQNQGSQLLRAVVVGLVLATSACSPGPSTSSPTADCTSQIRYQGVGYSNYHYVSDSDRGKRVGDAESLQCNDSGAAQPSVIEFNVTVWELTGTSPREALVVDVAGAKLAVYMADDLDSDRRTALEAQLS